MVDVGRITPTDIPPAKDSSIDVIRIATYSHQMEEALRLLDHCLEQGYETFMNVMAVSTLAPDAVDDFLIQLAGSGVHNVAIVDSFGALYPYHVRYLVHKCMNYLGENIKVGVISTTINNKHSQTPSRRLMRVSTLSTPRSRNRQVLVTAPWSCFSSIWTTQNTTHGPFWTESSPPA